MARLVLAAAGTLGDHLPVLALGTALQQRGHDVTAAVNPAMVRLFEGAGLAAVGCGEPFGPEEARARAHLFDAWQPPHADWARLVDLPRQYRELRDTCSLVGAEALLAAAAHVAAGFLAEDLALPWVSVHHAWEIPVDLPARLGLGSPRCAEHLALCLASPSFARVGSGEWLQLGGCRDSAALPAEWTEPAPALLEFLGALPAPGLDTDGDGRRPIVLLPGSTPMVDPAAPLRCLAAACRMLGRRLVVQRGWTGLRPELLEAGAPADHVHFADRLPHDWLLERAAALVFPGRPGVLAKALRAGCPMLVLPRTGTDFFNAKHILRHGIGVAMHPYLLTSEGAARMLAERVLLPEVRQRCRTLAKAARAEAGVPAACDLLEDHLARRIRRSAPGS